MGVDVKALVPFGKLGVTARSWPVALVAQAVKPIATQSG